MQLRATNVFVTVILSIMLILAGCGGNTEPSGASGATGPEGGLTTSGPPGLTGEAASGTDANGDETGPIEAAAVNPDNEGEHTGGRSGSLSESATEEETANGGQLQVHFIDVGQGQAQLVIGPTGKTMLIDGGNNDMEERIVAYLRDHGVSRVDILIGTHPDADHTGGLDAVVQHFDIGKIYMPRIQSNTKTFESLLLSIQQKGLKVTTAKAGLVLDWEPDVEVNMIAPVGTYDSTNEMSAVVHLRYGDTAFLFTGDAGKQSETDILQSGANVKADVLLVGHHGSSSSTSEAFLEKVAPAYGVIQAGSDNRYGHPHKEVLSRLAEKGVAIYRTDEHGNVVFASDGEHITVEQNPWTFNPAEKGAENGKKSEDSGSGEATQTDGESGIGGESDRGSHSGTNGSSGTGGQPASEGSASGVAPVPVPAPSQETEQSGVSDVVRELMVTAAIDDETPRQNSKLTVTVKVTDAQGNPVDGAEVTLLLHYKSTDTEYRGQTNASGVAELSFRIGRASKGYTVVGEITVQSAEGSGKSAVSFTPQ